jgi:hypothetical protein
MEKRLARPDSIKLMFAGSSGLKGETYTIRPPRSDANSSRLGEQQEELQFLAMQQNKRTLLEKK